MGLNDCGGRGATGDTGSQRDQVFLSERQAQKNNDFGICLEGETEAGILCCEVLRGSGECL